MEATTMGTVKAASQEALDAAAADWFDSACSVLALDEVACLSGMADLEAATAAIGYELLCAGHVRKTTLQEAMAATFGLFWPGEALEPLGRKGGNHGHREYPLSPGSARG